MLRKLKLNIRQRVLLLIFGCCMFTFLAMGVVAVHTFQNIRGVVDEQENVLGERLTSSLGNFSEDSIQKRLAENADLRALYIDRELAVVKEDVEILSNSISRILTSPEKYDPRTIANTQNQADIVSGVPYVRYSPALVEQGVSAKLAREIEIAANFKDVLLTMGKTYENYRTGLYAGSRNGYLIRLDFFPNGDAENSFQSEIDDENYDHRQRPWYKLGEQATQPVFTEPYNGTDGLVDVACVMPYRDSEGFAGVVGITYSVEEIYRQVADGTIGTTGFNFVVNGNGQVVLSTHTEGILAAGRRIDLRQSDSATFAEAVRQMTNGDRAVVLVTVDGKEYYLAFTPMQNVGWSFGMLLGKDEVMEPAKKIGKETSEEIGNFQTVIQEIFADSAVKSGLFMLALLILFFVVSRMAAQRITQPISELTRGVQEISGGNLDKKVQVQTGDELENLADCFNNMTNELSRYIENLSVKTAAEERTKTELTVAARIQEGMLPRTFPARAEFDLFASMTPAKAVGGDFYDFYLLDENHLVITIADVSDKGIPAALFMAMTKTLLKNNIIAGAKSDDLPNVMSATNDAICKDNEAGMFVTIFLAIINLSTGEMIYVNAGHNPPFIRRGGRFEALPKAQSPIFGVIDGLQFPAQKIRLTAGDALFLYTDGITEARNEQRKLFSEERLRRVLNGESVIDFARARDILSAVNTAVNDYVGEAQQSDDMTMLGLVYRNGTIDEEERT